MTNLVIEDGDIHVSRFDSRLNIGSERYSDLQLHLWIFSPEMRQQRSQDLGVIVFWGCKPDAPANFKTSERSLSFAVEGENLPGKRAENFAFLCQNHPAPVALENLARQLIFQPLNVEADGWLRKVDLGRGLGKAAGLHYGNQSSKLSRFEYHSLRLPLRGIACVP